MGEIKSALEIALQKAEKLGKLSPDELKAKKEEESRSFGQALAKRYLNEPHYSLSELEIALSKTGEEIRTIATQAFLADIIKAISLDNYRKPLEALRALRKDEHTKQVCQAIENLSLEYQQTKENTGKELQENLTRARKRELRELGITGSAISGVNIEESQEWKEFSGKIVADFQHRMEQSKSDFAFTNS